MWFSSSSFEHWTPTGWGTPGKLPLLRFYQISEQGALHTAWSGPRVGVETRLGLGGNGCGFSEGLTVHRPPQCSPTTPKSTSTAFLDSSLGDALRLVPSHRNPVMCGVQGSASTFSSQSPHSPHSSDPKPTHVFCWSRGPPSSS